MNPPRTALLLGGTGAVGSAVLRELTRAGIPTTFTFHRHPERAAALCRENDGARALPLDLRERDALPRLAETLAAEGLLPRILIHAAGVVHGAPLAQASDEQWDETLSIHARGAFQLCRDLGARLASQGGGGEIILLTALDRTQSLPMPVTFAASQGLVAALAMAAAKELAPRDVRVNVVALGLLDAGLGTTLDARLIADYKSFSALRRLGTPEEAAHTIAWLALRNTYLNGKVLSVNGGI